MDCRNARQLLDFARPGGTDLERDDRQALDGHLAVCPDCDSVARAERQADEHLGRAVRDVPVPQGLRERLRQRLAREREAWYRRWLARGLRTAAAVAAVVLVAWFGLTSWRKHNLVPCDEAALANAALVKHSYSPPSREDVEQRFRIVAPAEFDYRYLFGYHLDEYLDRRVPSLDFFRDDGRHGAQKARVYVLSSEQFDLRALPGEYKAPSGDRFRVEVWHRGKYAYVIIYNGSDLQDLLLPKSDRPGA